MYAKAFVWLLLGMLVVGGSIGGAFIGGIALGKSQGAEAAQDDPPAQSAASLTQQSTDGSDPQSPDQLRRGFQSGELSQEDLARLRQQFQSGQVDRQGGGGFAGGSFARRGGLSGTIESVNGTTVTVNTAQGPLQATVTADTTIQQFVEATLADLLEGMQVTVTGGLGEDGAVEAVSIMILPEGASDFLGGGFQGSRQQRGQQSP